MSSAMSLPSTARKNRRRWPGVPTTRVSASPSPSVSTAATRAPPRRWSSNAKKFSSSPRPPRRSPGRAGRRRSRPRSGCRALPSPSRSAALTFTPSRKDESKAKKFSSTLPVSSPSKTVTRGAPPTPVPTTMSSNPSPFTSSEPTFTPPRKRVLEGEEVADGVAGGHVDDHHPRAAAGPGPGDQVVVPVAVDVADRDRHPAGERRLVDEEVLDRLAGVPVVDGHPRPAVGGGRHRDVRGVVADQVADGHAHPAAERLLERHEPEHLAVGVRVDDHHERVRPGAGPDDQGVARDDARDGPALQRAHLGLEAERATTNSWCDLPRAGRAGRMNGRHDGRRARVGWQRAGGVMGEFR